MGTIARTIGGLTLRRSGDAEVFDRALRGDSIAFAEMYRRYYDRVYAFCLSLLLSREAATDAAQEVFLRALSADPASVRSPGSWLFGVARHVCIDITRKERRDAPARDDDLGADDALLLTDATAEDSALANRGAGNVLLALRRTSPRYRSALILREIHQQPMTDVADALGVSVPTAYTVLSRARDAFGKTYAEVLDLPEACRTAVQAIYRRTGTGISTAEQASLTAHIATCDDCRREADKAEGGSGMRAVLPLLPLGAGAKSLLARAAASFGSTPWPVEAAITHPAPWTAAKFAAAAVLATGMVTAAVGTSPAMVDRIFDPGSAATDAPAASTKASHDQDTPNAEQGEMTQAQVRKMSGAGSRQGGTGALVQDGTGGSGDTGGGAGPGPGAQGSATSSGGKQYSGGDSAGLSGGTSGGSDTSGGGTQGPSGSDSGGSGGKTADGSEPEAPGGASTDGGSGSGNSSETADQRGGR